MKNYKYKEKYQEKFHTILEVMSNEKFEILPTNKYTLILYCAKNRYIVICKIKDILPSYELNNEIDDELIESDIYNDFIFKHTNKIYKSLMRFKRK